MGSFFAIPSCPIQARNSGNFQALLGGGGEKLSVTISRAAARPAAAPPLRYRLPSNGAQRPSEAAQVLEVLKSSISGNSRSGDWWSRGVGAAGAAPPGLSADPQPALS
jgi:hypothetical protein